MAEAGDRTCTGRCAAASRRGVSAVCLSKTVGGIDLRGASLAPRARPWERQEISGTLREKCHCRAPRTMARQRFPLRNFAIAAAHGNGNRSENKARHNHRKRLARDGLGRSFLLTNLREKYWKRPGL